MRRHKSPEGLIEVRVLAPPEGDLEAFLDHACETPVITLASDLANIESMALPLARRDADPATAAAFAADVLEGIAQIRAYVTQGNAELAAHAALRTMGSFHLMEVARVERTVRVGRAKQTLPAKLGKERQKATPEAVERWRRMADEIRATNPNIHPTRWKSEIARRIAKFEGVAVNTVRSAL